MPDNRRPMFQKIVQYEPNTSTDTNTNIVIALVNYKRHASITC